MTLKNCKNFLLLIIVMVTISCDSKRVFEENKEIPGSVWNRNTVVSFKIPIMDTISPHNVYINIRQNGQYDKSNMYLFIDIISPKGDKIRDTVNCILADSKGKWLGSGLGDLYSNQLMYKHNIGFPHAGYYTFEIEQAMRVDNLKNVEDIGVRIERAR
jgi:gliding motility-associated lipoprotein GldH